MARTITAAAAAAERVTFVAKSFGTAILAHLDSAVLSSSRTEAIWLTPLFGYAAVRSGAIAHGWRSLLVAGDGDDYHDPEAHEAVREALGADSLILKDADDRLEIPGNPIATVDSLAISSKQAPDLVAPTRRECGRLSLVCGPGGRRPSAASCVGTTQSLADGRRLNQAGDRPDSGSGTKAETARRPPRRFGCPRARLRCTGRPCRPCSRSPMAQFVETRVN